MFLSFPPSIIDTTISFIFLHWRHLLWPGDMTRIKQNMKKWANCIGAHHNLTAGNGYSCFGFVDGTMRRMEGPTGRWVNRHGSWDGHHHMYALGFQGLIAPDGMFAQFSGPFTAFTNDKQMLKLSRLFDMLENEEFMDEDGCTDYFIYGDLGYNLSRHLMTGFMEPDARERLFNKLWSKDRVAVEWGFMDVSSRFQALNLMLFQKPKLSRIGVWYLVAVLLMNCYKCYYRCTASYHFDCDTPDIDVYLKKWDETFARYFSKYRPEVYPFRMAEEKLTEWNTTVEEWKTLVEEMDIN